MVEIVHPPPIARLPPHGGRPTWSVMIPVCNRLTWLGETLRSVLAQDPGREAMQIEIIDNSTDDIDVAGFVRGIAGDRVDYFRQPRHRTISENWNTCVERSRGELVHLLHDDDFVAAGFYSAIGQAAAEHVDRGVFVSRCFIIDDDGALDLLTDRIRCIGDAQEDITPLFYANPIRCPGVVIRRRVYEEAGGFRPDLAFTLDWEMWVRALHRAGGVLINRPLAFYRLGATGISLAPGKLAANLRDHLKLSKIFAASYPSFDRRTFNRAFSNAVLFQAKEFEAAGQRDAASEMFELWLLVAGAERTAIALLKAIIARDRAFFRQAIHHRWRFLASLLPPVRRG